MKERNLLSPSHLRRGGMLRRISLFIPRVRHAPISLSPALKVLLPLAHLHHGPLATTITPSHAPPAVRPVVSRRLQTRRAEGRGIEGWRARGGLDDGARVKIAAMRQERAERVVRRVDDEGVGDGARWVVVLITFFPKRGPDAASPNVGGRAGGVPQKRRGIPRLRFLLRLARFGWHHVSRAMNPQLDNTVPIKLEPMLVTIDK